MTELNLRKLKAKDARILGAAMGRHLPSLAGIQGDRESDEYRRAVGMKLIGIVLDQEIETLWSWIADLNGMTPEQLDDADPELPLAILQSLYEGDQLKGFLERLNLSKGQTSDTSVQ